MNVSPYLFFNGCCEEAIDYYKRTLGAEVEVLMRFSDAPNGSGPPGMPESAKSKIMHAALKVGETSIMASDGMCTGNKPSFEGVSLSIEVPEIALAQRLFDAFAVDGKVNQPLIETFFAPRFGMVADKFGLNWMIVVQQPAG